MKYSEKDLARHHGDILKGIENLSQEYQNRDFKGLENFLSKPNLFKTITDCICGTPQNPARTSGYNRGSHHRHITEKAIEKALQEFYDGHYVYKRCKDFPLSDVIPDTLRKLNSTADFEELIREVYSILEGVDGIGPTVKYDFSYSFGNWLHARKPILPEVNVYVHTKPLNTVILLEKVGVLDRKSRNIIEYKVEKGKKLHYGGFYIPLIKFPDEFLGSVRLRRAVHLENFLCHYNEEIIMLVAGYFPDILTKAQREIVKHLKNKNL